jgi:ribonuclease HI
MTVAVESDFLNYRRAELAAAEQALVKARENMRNAAERHGLPSAGLFSDSLFVWRTTAEKWAEEAERKGCDRGRSEILDALKAAREATSRSGPMAPFWHLDDDSSISCGRQ